ncbi:mechanosensitive ion channel [Clostridium boliviensis]|uniref:Mechanosensitive ion channel n=1 Tax=Clostridium boliviensis TaxID=318465 RepID=A0ABU4GQ82_9CLOT|nr:mechanosensitive ion channel domain-containing protein [Clostridium boliviensis]MDW2799779.1 mechanosensitive ion channel [Clostridium boliviensis]
MIFYLNTSTASVPQESLAALQEVQDNLEQLKPNVLMETMRGWMPSILAFGIKLLLALMIFFIGSRIIKLFYSMLNRSFRRVDMEVSVRKFLLSVTNAVMYCLLAFIIAGQIGVNSASIVALLGSASIAIGLAVQGSLANFAGGVLILLMNPFRVGDYIVSQSGEGTVHTIGLVYTVLTTPDNKQVVIPNGTLANSPLTNVTAMDKRRLDILVGISYDADLKKAKMLLQSIFDSQPQVKKDEPVDIFVSDLADSSVTLGGRGWTAVEDYWTARWEILERIKLEFEEAGIEIPYSQLDVHIKDGGK